MQSQNKIYFLIDFDSTFIKSEGLEELADIVLKKNPQKENILEKIKTITQQGMEGTMPFGQSLFERLQLLKIHKSDIEKLSKVLKKKITDSVLRNKSFFKTHADTIYIISGGFKEFILPVVKSFGIPEDHVFANAFLYDEKGNVIDFDRNNLLAQDNGKVKLVKSLNLPGDIYVIGDGYTDYKLKEDGLAKKFIAFTENIEREIVTKNADIVAPSFDEFLYINKLPTSISYPKSRIRALVLENIDQEAVLRLKKEGYLVKTYNKSLSEQELIEEIRDIQLLCIRSRTHITEKVLSHAPHLLAIGVFGIGTNNIDLSEAAQKGVAVFNAPFSSTRSVAELVIGEIFILMRGVYEKSNKLRQGFWDKSPKGSHEIKGKTLGIIGYGNIGSQLGLLAEAVGMKVIFYDVMERPILGNAEKASMNELLKNSDAISVHVDGNPKTINLIAGKEFQQMKEGVIFINSSRGFTVNVDALVTYLENGKIGGAAVDVFPAEPKSNDEIFTSPLQKFPNVILTPHIGGTTHEAQKNIAAFVSKKLIEFVNTGNTSLSVSLPNIHLSQQDNAHRLLHLHQNVPGILAKINGVFAQNNINILGQYLKTDQEIGYVITDVDKKYDKKVFEILKQIPNTIRFRVLY